MLKKISLSILIFFSLSSFAIVVTDEYLSTIEENWLSLEPADAYDFIPEDLTYEIYNSPEFQAKLEEAGTKLNKLLEGEDIALAGFMVPIEYVGSDISKFLLVPEAGQCIHVPPPPLSPGGLRHLGRPAFSLGSKCYLVGSSAARFMTAMGGRTSYFKA